MGISRTGAPLEFVVHETAGDFLAAAEPLINDKPDVHHQLKQIAMLVDVDSDFFEPPYGFWTIRKGNQIAGCALHVTPDGLVLSDMSDDVVSLLWHGIRELPNKPGRVVCDPVNTEAIKSAHRKSFKEDLRHQKTWTVGRLDSLTNDERCRQGEVRIGGIEDSKLIEKWAVQYSTERPAFLDVKDFMRKKLRAGDLYILDDGSPRAMATVSGRTRDGVRISSVFTARSCRDKGYGSAMVATLSNSLLQEGSSFVVITWKHGDQVGELYKQLGFQPVCYRQSLTRE